LGCSHSWQDAQGARLGVGGRDQTPSASVLAEQDSRSDGFGDCGLNLPPCLCGEALPWPIGQPNAQHSAGTCAHRILSTLPENRFLIEYDGWIGVPGLGATRDQTIAASSP
jgi:hypothetical protein